MPTPSICAPIDPSIRQMSTISGSRAALSMTVVPLARTAAMSRFSVAPTLGKSSHTVRAVQPLGARRDEEAVLAAHGRPEPLETGHVHVEAAAADVVAARQRDVGLAAAGEQRAEHVDRGAELAHEVVVGLVRRARPGP